MALIGISFHADKNTKAHTSHQEGTAVLVFKAGDGYSNVTIFGCQNEKDKFTKIAELFNTTEGN